MDLFLLISFCVLVIFLHLHVKSFMILRTIRKNKHDITFVKESQLDHVKFDLMLTTHSINTIEIPTKSYIQARLVFDEKYFIQWKMREDGTFVDFVQDDSRKWIDREAICLYEFKDLNKKNVFNYDNRKPIRFWSSRMWFSKLLKREIDEVFTLTKLGGFKEKGFKL